MKRSSQVAAPLLAAAALAMTIGCRKPEMQRCVDEHNNVVPDSFCKDQKDQPNQQPRPGFPIYHVYYGGWGGYTLGSTAGGGSYTPTLGSSYSTSSGVTTRGGFGSSFGGGSGGEGGAGE
jgi:hypothetical protein